MNDQETMHPLRKLRAEKDLPQVALGALSGVDPARISQIERGDHISWGDALPRLAKTLGVEPEALVLPGQADERALTGAPRDDSARLDRCAVAGTRSARRQRPGSARPDPRQRAPAGDGMTAKKNPNPSDENRRVITRLSNAEKEARERLAQTAATPGTQQTEARRSGPQADELHEAAGQVGCLRVPTEQSAIYGSMVTQFVGVGQGGAPVDAAIMFDAEPNGTWHGTVYRPGRLRDGGEHPVRQPGSVSWAIGEVQSLREGADVRDRPLLVVFGPTTIQPGDEPWDQLEALAAETHATVAIVRPADVKAMHWSVGRQEPEAEPEAEPTHPTGARVRDLQWLERVRITLRAADAGATAIDGPEGERLEVHYEQRDGSWRAQGFDEGINGELRPIKVNLAPEVYLTLDSIPLGR